MSLRDVARAVAVDFRNNSRPALVQFGTRFIAEHGEPPRVVFCPSAQPDRYGPPLQIQSPGPLPQSAAYVQSMGGANPRPIATRIVSTEIHIWGCAPSPLTPAVKQEDADQDGLDALINQTVLSLFKVAPGNNRSLTGSQKQGPSHVRRGLVYVLNAIVEVPIVDIEYTGKIDECDRTWTLVPVEQFNITVQQIDLDGVVDYTVSFLAGDPEV